jgi:hypothetical protein
MTKPNNGLGYAGFQRPGDSGSEYNAISALIWNSLSKIAGATLVQVKLVTNDDEDSSVGFVDVLPLINQVDGAGNAFQHDVVHGLPYFRLQGGTNAVILDPQVGDIGLAVFADRDISSVIENRANIATNGKPVNPGSSRISDWADGLYIGGFLNGTPVQYVQFNSDGITVKTPNSVNINAGGDVTVNATGNATINAASAIIKAGSIALQNAGSALKSLLNSAFATWAENHVHGNGNGGGNTTGPTTAPPTNGQTSVVQAE